MGQIVDLSKYRSRRKSVVYFSRLELNMLLSLFSRRVLIAEWRDYTIDNREGFAAFCVYRRTNDAPLYTVMRLAANSHPQGDYLVLKGDARLRRGRSLAEVMGAFAPPLRALRS